MNLRTSFCLILVMLVALANNPSAGSDGEPPVIEELVCAPYDGFLLHIILIQSPWLGCEISDDLDPVGADLPTIFADQTSRRQSRTDERLSSDHAGSDRPPQPPLDQSSDTSKTPRSGTTNIGKL